MEKIRKNSGLKEKKQNPRKRWSIWYSEGIHLNFLYVEIERKRVFLVRQHAAAMVQFL